LLTIQDKLPNPLGFGSFAITANLQE